MKKIILVFLFTCFVLPAFAADDELLIDKLSGPNGFTMKFEQASKYKFLKTPKISKGKLTFLPPKSFIWEIQGDNAGKIISNGKKTWIYSPADEEGDMSTVMVKNGFYDGVQSIVFNPKYKMSSLTKKDGKLVLRVKGGKSKGYMWAEISFVEAPDFRIDSVVFEDVESSRVTIKATDFNRANDKLNAGAFNFKIPKGARIINK